MITTGKGVAGFTLDPTLGECLRRRCACVCTWGWVGVGGGVGLAEQDGRLGRQLVALQN